MGLEIVILILSIIITGISVWAFTSKFYEKKQLSLTEENLYLKNKATLNEDMLKEMKISFSEIAQNSLKNQQEALLSEHSKDLKNRLDLFKAEEITPVNKLLQEFKESIDKYQLAHQSETQEIKSAIATAEKYARALTMNQNSKGEFGEEWLEQIFKFANLEENIHYIKQYTTPAGKPDFIVNLPKNKSIIIDSKVILKNYLEYNQDENNQNFKKNFINDITNCITDLAKRNYEEIEEFNQPGFILMYLPIESCVNLIYTDYEFKKVVELAIKKNIIIVGTASLLVTLRLVNQLWASQVQYDNVREIITVGENLYNNMATHAKKMSELQQIMETALSSIKTELNRFTTRGNGSIFKEAEKLRQYGISHKEIKSGKKLKDNLIPEEYLS